MCVRVSMCVFMHTRLRACVYAYVCACVCLCVRVCVRVSMRMRVLVPNKPVLEHFVDPITRGS